MYRYKPDYESHLADERYKYERLRSQVQFESFRRQSLHVRLMEKVQRFVSENFLFRIEGVDSDDASEPLTSNTEREIQDKSPPLEVEATKHGSVHKFTGYDSAPEIVVQIDHSSGGSELDKVEVTPQPTQFSCLSISIYSAVIIAMVCIFLFIGRDYVKYILLSLEEADFWISLVIFCVLFTIVSFPMTWGYILLNIAAGYLYGLVLGLVIVISCALTGLFIAHCVIRRCLRNFVLTKFTNKSFVSIMNVVDHSSIGYKVVIWARLTPIPFGLQNALFAVCGISTPRYILASMLGMLPTQGMHAYIGSTLRSMEEVISSSSGSTTAYFVFGAQLLIAIGLLCFVIRRARAEFNRMVQNAQPGVAPSGEQPKAPATEATSHSHGHGTLTVEKAHSRSASVPGALVPQKSLYHERPRAGSFSPKPALDREHSH